MHNRHVDFAAANIYITDIDETLEETKSTNDDDREHCNGALVIDATRVKKKHGRHVDFAATNIYITDEMLAETKSTNDDNREQCQGALCVPNPPSPAELRDTVSPSPIEPQVYARISCGSESLVRYPLAKRPIDTGLFDPQELIRPAVCPGKDNIIVRYPPMDMWEVIASNGLYITVGDVLVKLYDNRTSFPPGTLFNGLLLTDDEALLLKFQ